MAKWTYSLTKSFSIKIYQSQVYYLFIAEILLLTHYFI